MHEVRVEEGSSSPPWQAVAGVAAFVAVQLKIATFAGGAALWRYTRGSFWATFSPELTYLVFTAVFLPLGALWLARHPPRLRAPLRSAARLLMLASIGVVLHIAIFYQLMVRIDMYPPDAARAILFSTIPRNLNGWLILLGLAALVIWGLRVDQERARQDRRRLELERELAVRSSAAVRRSVHPRFIARRLDALAATIEAGGDAELAVHRIARYLRLLQRDRGDTVRLLTEMNLLATLERLSPFRFDIELPEEQRDVRVTKGLAAAFAELATGDVAPHELHVRVKGLSGQRVLAEVAAGPAGAALVSALRMQLQADELLAGAASVIESDGRLLVTYAPATGDAQPEAVPAPPPPSSPVSRWIPLVAALVVSVRVFFVAAGVPIFDGARRVAAVLWLVAGAPLLMGVVVRLRGPFMLGLIGAAAAAALFGAAVSVIAVELFSRIGGVAAILPAGHSPWLAIPRDSATIGTAVALSALLGNRARRNAEERARALRLETLLSRADAGALEARFHPHFLFNSLNAVLALLHEDRAAARLMARRLAELFHDVVGGDTVQEWSLAEERDLAERYLDVMGVRFGDRLRVVWRVPRKLERVRVPRLLLQPLVENAIQHGIARRVAPGTLTIAAARRDGDELSLTVENDTGAATVVPPARRGGLTYVTQRLALLYGPGSIPRYSAGPGTFRVEVTVPCRDVTS